MSEAELAEIEARANAATLGPWEANLDSPGEEYPRHLLYPPDAAPISCLVVHSPPADAAFIAAARQDIPALLAEVRRLRALVADPAPIPEHCPVCGRPRIYACARL